MFVLIHSSVLGTYLFSFYFISLYLFISLFSKLFSTYLWPNLDSLMVWLGICLSFHIFLISRYLGSSYWMNTLNLKFTQPKTHKSCKGENYAQRIKWLVHGYTGSDGIGIHFHSQGFGAFWKINVKQVGLKWLCSPKLKIIELLEKLIISHRIRGFQPLISPVTPFEDGMMGGLLFSFNFWDWEMRAWTHEGFVLLVKLVGLLFPWPVLSGCSSDSWVLMESEAMHWGWVEGYLIISGLAGRKQHIREVLVSSLGKFGIRRKDIIIRCQTFTDRSFVASRISRKQWVTLASWQGTDCGGLSRPGLTRGSLLDLISHLSNLSPCDPHLSALPLLSHSLSDVFSLVLCFPLVFFCPYYGQ